MFETYTKLYTLLKNGGPLVGLYNISFQHQHCNEHMGNELTAGSYFPLLIYKKSLSDIKSFSLI